MAAGNSSAKVVKMIETTRASRRLDLKVVYKRRRRIEVIYESSRFCKEVEAQLIYQQDESKSH